jgi:hypothetical protein
LRLELARNACHDSAKALEAHVRNLSRGTWDNKAPISEHKLLVVMQAYYDFLEILNAAKLNAAYKGPATSLGPRQRAMVSFSNEAIERC